MGAGKEDSCQGNLDFELMHKVKGNDMWDGMCDGGEHLGVSSM